MPVISVIIPVYNKEKYIETALRSVLSQSLRDIEVIVVDDGSTDKSASIAAHAAESDSRVQLIRIPNGGVSNARNIGLSYASGEWIQFLDADDRLEGDYLAQALGALKENPADILFSGFRMVDEQGNTIREIAVPAAGKKTQKELCECFIRSQYETGFFGYISNKLFRRSLIAESGAQFPAGITLAEDLDFYAKLYPAVKTAYFWDGVSFCYLQTGDNYLLKADIDYYAQLQVHLDIKAWFKKSGLYPVYRNVLDRKVSQYAYYVLFYDNESGTDLSHAVYWLRARTEITESLSPAGLEGFSSAVLRCLCRGDLLGIKVLFLGRTTARSFIRMVKRNG